MLDLFSAKGTYGGNYVVFYINVGTDSKLAKLVGAMWIHLPQHEENINHPEFGRHTYIYGIAYENAQYNKCVAALLKELVRQYSTSLPPSKHCGSSRTAGR